MNRMDHYSRACLGFKVSMVNFIGFLLGGGATNIAHSTVMIAVSPHAGGELCLLRIVCGQYVWEDSKQNFLLCPTVPSLMPFIWPSGMLCQFLIPHQGLRFDRTKTSSALQRALELRRAEMLCRIERSTLERDIGEGDSHWPCRCLYAR